MIIYFTGTGNSRYLAELLAKRLDDVALDATKFIKSGEEPSFTSEKPYIFVSPVYAWRIPRLFEKWIKKCGFSGNKKAYFVLNCGESVGAAANYVRKLAKAKSFDYMGTAKIVMPENYIVMFDLGDGAEDEKTISTASRRAEELSLIISEGGELERVKVSFLGHLASDVVTPFFYRFYISAKRFYTTDKCISCDKCTESCMLNNITLKDGKPTWGGECIHCMACISKCPTEAIEYGKKTKGRRRYVCKR